MLVYRMLSRVIATWSRACTRRPSETVYVIPKICLARGRTAHITRSFVQVMHSSSLHSAISLSLAHHQSVPTHIDNPIQHIFASNACVERSHTFLTTIHHPKLISPRTCHDLRKVICSHRSHATVATLIHGVRSCACCEPRYPLPANVERQRAPDLPHVFAHVPVAYVSTPEKRPGMKRAHFIIMALGHVEEHASGCQALENCVCAWCLEGGR